MKIRVGDVVFYHKEEWRNQKYVKEEIMAIVDGTEEEWWVIKDCVSTHEKGDIGSIIHIKDIFSIIKRIKDKSQRAWDKVEGKPLRLFFCDKEGFICIVNLK